MSKDWRHSHGYDSPVLDSHAKPCHSYRDGAFKSIQQYRYQTPEYTCRMGDVGCAGVVVTILADILPFYQSTDDYRVRD